MDNNTPPSDVGGGEKVSQQTVYYGGQSEGWFEEIGACASADEAAVEFASMHGLCVGDEFWITSDPSPNPDHDPEWPTGEENPELFLNGPTHHYTLQAIRIGGAQ